MSKNTIIRCKDCAFYSKRNGLYRDTCRNNYGMTNPHPEDFCSMAQPHKEDGFGEDDNIVEHTN